MLSHKRQVPFLFFQYLGDKLPLHILQRTRMGDWTPHEIISIQTHLSTRNRLALIPVRFRRLRCRNVPRCGRFSQDEAYLYLIHPSESKFSRYPEFHDKVRGSPFKGRYSQLDIPKSGYQDNGRRILKLKYDPTRKVLPLRFAFQHQCRSSYPVKPYLHLHSVKGQAIEQEMIR